MEDQPRGKNLRDYTPRQPEALSFSLPKGEESTASPPARHPSVGETRGTGNSMGPRSSGTSEATAGAFCSTRIDGSDVYIVGGAVRYNNTKSLTVPDFLIPGSSDFVVFVEVNVVAARDDSESYLTFGIASSADTSLTMDTHATAYPAGTDPTVAVPDGTITLEVGSVTFDGSDPTFFPAGCGTFHLKHCRGELGYEPRF